MTATLPPASPPATTRRPWRRRLVAAIAALLILTLASTAPILLRILRDGAGQSPIVGATDVILQDSWFSPSVVEVPTGTTVTFHFLDGDIPHDVAFEDGVASEIATTGTYERTFEHPTNLTYRCTLHPGMTGRVIVSE